MVVGLLGGGQLARMLAQAAHPLGIKTVFLDPAVDACAQVAADHICAAFDDTDALDQFAARVDVISYEFENVPFESVQRVAKKKPVFPPADAVAVAQDRLVEKTMFGELGIATAEFRAVDNLSSLANAAKEIGLPAVLKTRRMGYDGKGQAIIWETSELEESWSSIGEVPAILEAFVPFDRELSIIAVRSQSSRVEFYPASENTHADGILRLSLSRVADPCQGRAEEYVGRLLNRFGYVGVIALELFQLGDDLIANEFAPRVHNSGHWTIEGAEISQFENHMRAICGLPLGSTQAVGKAAMVNFIGKIPTGGTVMSQPNVFLHDYGKVAKPGRKVGHATVQVQTDGDFVNTVDDILALAK